MADFRIELDPFIEDMIEVVGDIWPEVIPNGIWELDQIVRRAFVFRGFPYAVIDTPRMVPADWGITNEAYQVLVETHYIALEEGTPGTPTGLSVLKVKLPLLANRLLRAAFRNGVTLLTEPEIDWSGTHPANVFFYEKDQPFRGGVVGAPFVFTRPAMDLV